MQREGEKEGKDKNLGKQKKHWAMLKRGPPPPRNEVAETQLSLKAPSNTGSSGREGPSRCAAGCRPTEEPSEVDADAHADGRRLPNTSSSTESSFLPSRSSGVVMTQ